MIHLEFAPLWASAAANCWPPFHRLILSIRVQGHGAHSQRKLGPREENELSNEIGDDTD